MKTAIAFVVMGGVLGQDGYVAPGPVTPPKGGSTDGPYVDVPAPVDPPAPPPYDGGNVDPAPVDPPKDVYEDAPPPPPDYTDKDEYADVQPTPSDVYDDDSDDDDDTAPTDVYDDGTVDDDDDYGNGGVPAPDTGYSPAPAPKPVYSAPAQKECGALYVDVIKTVLEQILGNIDPNIITHIINLLQELLGYVKDLDPKNPASLAKVVEHVNQIAVYCDQNIPDIGDNAKHFVVDAFSKMKDTYGSVYDTAVDTHVYDAWEHLWNSCKTSPDATHAPEYVDRYYKAYTGYLKDGPSSPAYQQDIDHLCTSSDPDVSKYANDTKTAITTLSQEATDDGSVSAESNASKLLTTFATFAGLAAFFF